MLALTVALGACIDGTGLDDEPFDPAVSAADLQAVQTTFNSSSFESLAASSGGFTLVPDTVGVPVAAMVRAGWAATTDSRWEAQAAAQRQAVWLRMHSG